MPPAPIPGAPAGSSKLLDWLATRRVRQSVLADVLGVSRASVHAWCAGRSRPCYEFGCVLDVASCGRVPLPSWAEQELSRAAVEAIRAIPGVPRRLIGRKLERMQRLVCTPDHSSFRLEAWLRALRVRNSDLARALGVSPQTSSLWVRRMRRPSYEHTRAMQDASCGLVPMSGWARKYAPSGPEWSEIAKKALERFTP